MSFDFGKSILTCLVPCLHPYLISCLITWLITWLFAYLHIFATLGSILDSQLSWESGKSQLARWSHRVVLFSGLDHPPTPHPPTAKLFLILLCGVPTSTKYVRCPPLLVYVFSRSHLFSSSKKYVRCPPPNVAFSDIVVRCPHLNKVCAVSPLLVYVFSRSHLFFSSKKYVRCPPPCKNLYCQPWNW